MKPLIGIDVGDWPEKHGVGLIAMDLDDGMSNNQLCRMLTTSHTKGQKFPPLAPVLGQLKWQTDLEGLQAYSNLLCNHVL